ncbi:hypothetical protein ACKWTF_012587 [Chironomus riparius]
MSRKISDYFQIEAKKSKTEETSSNPIQVRECHVVLTDINEEIRNGKSKSLLIIKPKSDPSKIEDITKKQEESITSNQEECKLRGKIVLKSNNTRHMLLNCEKEFKDSSNNNGIFNQNHRTFDITKSHIKSETKIYECDLDGKKYKSRFLIFMHMKSHLPKVKCKICSKLFTFMSLYNHMKQTHAPENNVQCEICLKSFKSSNNLKKHKKIHDKKFQCEICGVHQVER